MNVNTRLRSAATIREGLRTALSFHASFDNNLDADFAVGDGRIYHGEFPLYADPKVEPHLAPGPGSPPVALTKPGKFGSALAFTGEKGDEKEQGDGSGSVRRNVLLVPIVHMLAFSGLRLDPASPGETWRSPGMIAKPEPHTA